MDSETNRKLPEKFSEIILWSTGEEVLVKMNYVRDWKLKLQQRKI